MSAPRGNPRPQDPPDLDRPEFDPSIHCHRCSGCRYIASSDEGESWLAWTDLPRGSDMAVVLGIVAPLPCPSCHRTGLRPDRDALTENPDRGIGCWPPVGLMAGDWRHGTARVDRPRTGGPWTPEEVINRLTHQHLGPLTGLHADLPALRHHVRLEHVGVPEGADLVAWHGSAHADPSTVAAVPDVVAPEVLADLADGADEVTHLDEVSAIARGMTERFGIPVAVDASLEEDVIEIRRPDGSVAVRRRLTEPEARVLGSPLPAVSVFRGTPDEEAWASQVVALARAAGAEMVQLGAGEPFRVDDVVDAQIMCGEVHPRSGVSCSRPDGHGLPHVHFDSTSEAAGSPVVQWRSVTE